jgi:hypothetical protein
LKEGLLKMSYSEDLSIYSSETLGTSSHRGWVGDSHDRRSWRRRESIMVLHKQEGTRAVKGMVGGGPTFLGKEGVLMPEGHYGKGTSSPWLV